MNAFGFVYKSQIQINIIYSTQLDVWMWQTDI